MHNFEEAYSGVSTGHRTGPVARPGHEPAQNITGISRRPYRHANGPTRFALLGVIPKRGSGEAQNLVSGTHSKPVGRSLAGLGRRMRAGARGVAGWVADTPACARRSFRNDAAAGRRPLP